MVDLERTVWSYKFVEEKDLGNKMLEIIINFYEKNKFELNINKFSSLFDINLETFLDNSNQDDKTPVPDDVFQSNYHHSLILGNYIQIKENMLNLVIEKVFTNEQELFNEKNKEFQLGIDNNFLTLNNDNVIGRLLNEPSSIILSQIKQKK